MKSLTVIGIIHKDEGTAYGVNFPGLPDAVFETADNCGPAFAGSISALLKEYFAFKAAGNADVTMDMEKQSRILDEPAETDPSRTGYTESTVTIDGRDIKVSTSLHSFRIG